MTITQLFENMEVKGCVSIHNKDIIQTFYCNGRYPLDNINIKYWNGNEEIESIVADDNKLVIIIKE